MNSSTNLLTRSTLWVALPLLLALGGCDQTTSSTKESGDEAATVETSDMEVVSEYTTDMAKASYSLGFTLADNVAQRFAGSVDVAAFKEGVDDRFSDQERAVSMEDATAALQTMAQEQQAAMDTRAEDNLAEGIAFLEQNGAREDVVTLPSGLQYEVLTAAEGDMPLVTDSVTTHYHGTFIDGKVFDSSYDRGEPASFPLNGVIPGWTEALQLMAVGAKWRLYIPPDLAYGAQERGPIPGNSTLIFDVELLEIENQDGE